MPSKSRVLVAVSLLYVSMVPLAPAATTFDQLIGIRISQLVTHKILGSPPLPSLKGTNERPSSHFTPQVSYLTISAENVDSSSNSALYRGSLKGYTAGAGFTQDSHTNVSYYGFGTLSQASGSINQLDQNLTAMQAGLRDIQDTAINLSTGISYRLWSETKFPFVVGLLGGPYISSFSSKFVYYNSSGIGSGRTEANYSSQSFVYGPMAGVQAYVNLVGIGINPYFLQYWDISSPCQSYDTNASVDVTSTDSAKSCNATNHEIYMEGSFYAYGLNLEVWGISFGALTKIENDPDLSSITARSYTLSYTFDF